MISYIKTTFTLVALVSLLVMTSFNCKGADEEIRKLYTEATKHVQSELVDLEAVDKKDLKKIKELSRKFNKSMMPFIERKIALQDKYPDFRRDNKEFFARHHKTFMGFVMTYYKVLKAGIAINKQNPNDKEFKDIGYETKFILEAMMSDNDEIRANPASKKLGIIQ